MASAKQIAWRKKFGRMAKAGKFKKPKSFKINKKTGSVSSPMMDRKYKGGKMKIDKRSETSVYITMGDWEVYLDNSTGERIIDTLT